MDPIEKKFQEAFADYQFPVDDGLWDQVLEKKNRRKPFPWIRLAAAITLLLLAGVLLWPEQSTQPTELVETTIPSIPETPVHLDPVEETNQTESESTGIKPESQLEQRVRKATPLVVHQHESAPLMQEQDELIPQSRREAYADLPRLNRKQLPHVRHTSAPVALPLPDVQWSPITTIEQSDVADVPVIEKIKRTQSDVTGPARLVNVLEKNSPKLVKDIIAFGSARRTEIEVNW